MARAESINVPVDLNLEEFYRGLMTVCGNMATLQESQALQQREAEARFRELWRAEQAKNDPSRREPESG